jgi:hypothetical protein
MARLGSGVDSFERRIGSPFVGSRAAAVKSAFGPALQLDEVRVTRNSPKRTQLRALAHAQGSDIQPSAGALPKKRKKAKTK